MKKLFGVLAIAAALFAVSSIARPNVARADGAALGVYCQAIAPGIGLSQGECAKLIASFGPVICTGDFDNDGVPNYQEFGFKNAGECISTVQRFIRDELKTL